MDAIALYQKNEREGYPFMSLETGNILHSNIWTQLPIIPDIIEKVQVIAKEMIDVNKLFEEIDEHLNNEIIRQIQRHEETPVQHQEEEEVNNNDDNNDETVNEQNDNEVDIQENDLNRVAIDEQLSASDEERVQDADRSTFDKSQAVFDASNQIDDVDDTNSEHANEN